MKRNLLTDILWNFKNSEYDSIQNFISELTAYNEELSEEGFDFDPSEEALATSKVVVQYSFWDEKEEDTIEPDFLLSADNGKFFTKGELMFKVHNKVCEALSKEDNSYFEGFLLWEGENPNNPDIPLYFLVQGS